MGMYLVHIAILFVQPSGLSKGRGGGLYACVDRLQPKHERKKWLGFMVTIQRDEGPQQTPSTGLREDAGKRCTERATIVPAKYGMS